MSPAAGAQAVEDLVPALLTFAFGGPEGTLWGTAWIPVQDRGGAVLAAGGQVDTAPLEIAGRSPQETWQAHGPGGELSLEPLGEPVWTDGPGVDRFDQLCRVTGKLQGATVATLGWRSAGAGDPERRRLGSVRQVAAWFDSEEGFALLALRPRDDKGQERDEVTAALFHPGQSGQVSDPRLSTTYTHSGNPIRAGVELWVQAGEDPEQQYPRRAIGEAMQPPVELAVEDMTFQALPFRWHSSAGEGGGVYLLGTWAKSPR